MTEIVIPLLAAILAIVLHEVAHGYAALALGDDTAKNAGRLTLNPIAHVDRVGTLIVPGILLILQSIFGGHFMFGWAKPVPVAAWKFRDPRRGMMIVAAAGPAMNFVLAYATALALHLELGELFETFAFSFILFNLLLGLFNLLPIPPLDGGHAALLLAGARRERAVRKVAIGVAALVVLWGVATQNIFVVLLVGLMGYRNYQVLQEQR